MRQVRAGRVARWSRIAAVLVVMAVTAQAGGGPVAAGPEPEPEAPATAVAAAREQGTRVEATGLRTETRTVYAEPDGTMTAELSTRPVRVARDGSWVNVDTTLVRRPDGTVGPVAAAVELAFSGSGADAPLVRYGTDGDWIALSWPGELPVPTLAGDTATYPEVLPGSTCRCGRSRPGTPSTW